MTFEKDRPTNDPSTPRPLEHEPSVRKGRTIAGLPIVVFVVASVITLVAGITDHLPVPMVAGFAVSMLLGGLLMWIGDLIPALEKFGVPVILCVLVPAVLVGTGVMPKPLVTAVSTFTDDLGFLDFFVIAIVAGSILGMPSKLLRKAGLRFIVPLLSTIICTLFVIGAIGAVVGFGFREALLTVAAPVMAGGLGLGAVPMSQIYAGQFGGSASHFFSILMSATVLGNTISVIVAAVLRGLTDGKQLFVGFNGHGQLIRLRANENASDFAMPKEVRAADFSAFGVGLLISCVLLFAGMLLNAVIPDVHEFAWAVLLATFIKLTGLLPKKVEEAAYAWNLFNAKILVPALLVCVAITYVDVGAIVNAVTDPLFVGLVIGTVLCSALLAGTIGWLVRLNFVESAVVPGLVMADSGGSGDVAVMTAANRLHLMPFAQFATRLGGVLTLLMATLLAPLL